MLSSPFRSKAERAVRIASGRVYIRPPRQGDWQAWSASRHESRDFLVPWEPTWSPDALTRQAFRHRIRTYDSEWRQGSSHSFLIFRRADDALLGGVTLGNVRRGVADMASLGYWIGARHARRGHMTEALAGVLDFAFERLGLHRVEAACLPSNTASKCLLLKIGFTQEGYTRKYLRINGEWRDHLLFAVLREDARRRPEP